jgi:hypothetical protein
MKTQSLRRWVAVLCLTAGTWLGQASASLALTPEQIQAKLQEIPVFTIGNEKGEILLAGGGKDEKKSIVLFISQDEAQKSVQKLKESNPNQSLQVVPISLGRMYQTIKDSQKEPNAPLMSLVPIPSQLNAAQQLSGNNQPFQGVPLFYATIKADAPQGNNAQPQESYLTASGANNQPIIPFYFEKETIQELVEEFKKAQPTQANSVQLRVVPLEILLTAFERNDNPNEEKAKENMVIVPSQESLKFIRTLQQQPANQNPPALTPQKK